MNIDYDLADAIDPPPPGPKAEREWKLQARCATIAKKLRRQDKAFEFEFINMEGQRNSVRAAIAKMMGFERGTLEVRLYYKRDGLVRMAVGDCKRKKGALSKAQKKWFDYYAGTQVRAFEVRTTDDFRAMVNWVRADG